MECAPEFGGIVRSLTWRGIDVLRPSFAGDKDPLGSGMFPLVPFSNRLERDVPANGRLLKLPRFLDDCSLAIHGFGWQNAWEILAEESDQQRITMQFCDKQSPWPAPYKATQTFLLDDKGFHASLAVTNIGETILPAGIGFHPYFLKGDCKVAIGLEQKWSQDQLGLPLRSTVSDWSSSEKVRVSGRRVDHSYSGWNGHANMQWPARNLAVELTTSDTLREVVIYSPKDDFFCIEPVSHLTNAMFALDPELKRGWRKLEPGDTLSGRATLRAKAIS